MKSLLKYLFALLASSSAFAADADKPADPPPHIVIVGGTRTDGAIPFTEGLTVSQLILKTGGFADFGTPRVFLIRNAKGTRIPIREILEKGEIEKDVRLQPWDIIFISKHRVALP